MDKVVNREELLREIAAARAAGETVVHCHGCFDIVHPGHVRYLEFARQQGELLVVSLTGDSQISKGDQRPYIPQELRAENLAALESVDLVYVNPHPTAVELIGELRPDVYVKGREYAYSSDAGFIAERDAVTAGGGRVVFSSGDVVFSSTRLIESLSREPSLEGERLALLCRRHGITRDTVERQMAAFRDLRVLVIGDLLVDRYVLCDAVEQASEAPMMSLARLEERVYVGGAGILARQAAALGATTFLLSTAGDDEASEHARATLEAENVASMLLPVRKRLPQRTRYLVETQKMLRVEDAASVPLDSEREREALHWVSEAVGTADVVLCFDGGYGAMTAALAGRLRTLFGDRCVRAGMSEGRRGRLLAMHGFDLLCPAERELRAALHDFDGGLSSVAWNGLEQTQARHLLVSLSKRGHVIFDRQSQDPADAGWRGRLRSEYLPSLASSATDPLGCDEAMLAAAALALAVGEKHLGTGGTLMHAAYLGAGLAALQAERLGNTVVPAESLHRWLHERAELRVESPAEPARPKRIPAGML